jgi:septum formation protein
MTHDFIYQASQSPRRSQLLTQLGVRHELLLPQPGDVDADAEALEAEREGELPADYVTRVTRAKLHAAQARLVRRGLPPAPVLASDTTVALGRQIYGKPVDAADVHRILGALSGRRHRVLTGVALAWADREAFSLQISSVRFAAIDATHIDAYIANGEPFGKAGAYGIQGAAAGWVVEIEGSPSGIMGLPLYETAQLLSQARVRY